MTHPILDEVAAEYGVTPEQLCSPSRKFILVHARWKIMRTLKKEGLSCAAIGRVINRTAPVVWHGLKAS